MEYGIYLWLYLAIDNISYTYWHSFRPEEASIKLLLSTVEDAYEKILRRVTEGQKNTVEKILQIMVGARRPLSIAEMAIALRIAMLAQRQSLDKAKRDAVRVEWNICQSCGPFVFTNHDRMYLIHQTAKGFFDIYECFYSFPVWVETMSWSARNRESPDSNLCRISVFLDTIPTAQALVQRPSPQVPPIPCAQRGSSWVSGRKRQWRGLHRACRVHWICNWSKPAASGGFVARVTKWLESAYSNAHQNLRALNVMEL